MKKKISKNCTLNCKIQGCENIDVDMKSLSSVVSKISKKELYFLYWKKEKSARNIAGLYQCSSSTIYTKMTKYNIKKEPFQKL